MRILVPSQVTQEYTPDMVGEVPGANTPGAFLNRVTDKSLVHFHIEEATIARPERVFANLARAVKAGAFPVMVLHDEACTDKETQRLTGFYERLQALMTNMGTYPVPEEVRQEVGRNPRRVFAAWFATKDARLYEYQDGRGLVEIGSRYQGIGRKDTPLAPAPVAPTPQPAPSKLNPIQLLPPPDNPPVGDPLVVFCAIMNRAVHAKVGKVYRKNVIAEMARDATLPVVATDKLDEWAIERFQCRLEAQPMDVLYYLD